MLFELSTVNLINTIMISMGIGVCGMCFLHITTSVNLPRRFRRSFQVIFVLLSFYMIFHLARRLMEGHSGEALSFIIRLLPNLEITTAGFLSYMISMLLLSIMKPPSEKYMKVALRVLLALFVVQMAHGRFTDLYLYFDEMNYYHRGTGYLIVNIAPTIMLVMDMVLLILHGKKIGRRVKIAYWTYLIAPVIAMVVQGISYGIQYIILATVSGSVFMYFVIVKEQVEWYEKQTKSITKLQNGLITVMADLVESRDKCTGNHIHNTAEYTRIIMEQMRRDGSYADALTDEFIEDVVRSAPLHDIGKIQVSDVILNKPGKLTPEEFEVIKLHTAAGRDIIGSAIDMVSEENSGYLNEAKNLAYCHHEKWDGTGYPEGLSGEDIPLSARIMAVADVFDALVSKRSYKDEFPFDEAVEIIKDGAGGHFDPKVADAFVKAVEEVRHVLFPAEK